MTNVAIIGAGVSGLTMAHLLKNKFKVTVFERECTPGGLIRCKRVNNSLFHLCGGHVFNSKRQDVLNWFWSNFKQDEEFIKADRNSVVYLNKGQEIPYPIENHMYMMSPEIQKAFINDLLTMTKENYHTPNNFEDFLLYRFGPTLYNLYFKPYNEKIWKRTLNNVPLSWLEGKLPMPTIEEMIYNNINHLKEKSFVHSQFWYEKNGGSQFLADRLANGLNIQYNTDIEDISYDNKNHVWKICNQEFTKVIFCGNIKELISNIKGIDLSSYYLPVESLEYHGTTAVFCEIDKNPYSWIYLPSKEYKSHRIICTGNFSSSNNVSNRLTATIEFTDEINREEIEDNLKRIPLHPQYYTHQYNKYTYPIQDANTRDLIKELKKYLSKYNLYFTGRFADWEYYNMDVAMGAAMDLANNIK